MNIVKKKRTYSLISADTTKHCNARCVFCFNDWSRIKPCTMVPETFHQLLKLMPLVSDNSFYLSCLYEPTINPNFFNFLREVPKAQKSRVFFTTNLVRKLSFKELWIMAHANVDHINISLETFNRDTYAKLAGVKNSCFYENLKKLGKLTKLSGQKINLITMMTRTNYDELVAIVREAHNMVHPFNHELRTSYFFKADEKKMDRAQAEMLTRDEINRITDQIKALGYTNLTFATGPDLDMFIRERKKSEAEEKRGIKPFETVNYVIRVGASGALEFGGTDISVNINSLDDPYEYCLQMLKKLQAIEADQFFMEENPAAAEDIIETDAPMALDEAIEYDGRYLVLTGWETWSVLSRPEDAERILMLKNKDRSFLYHLMNVNRPDVVTAMHNVTYLESGFRCAADKQALNCSGALKVYIGWKKGDQLSIREIGVIEDK